MGLYLGLEMGSSAWLYSVRSITFFRSDFTEIRDRWRLRGEADQLRRWDRNPHFCDELTR